MRYFIIPFNSPNLAQIQAVIFGDISNQRPSLDRKYFAASLNEGDKNNYECLKDCPEYDEKGFLVVLEGENWKPKTFL